MIGWLREWIVGMTAAALCCSIAMSLTPEGGVKRVLSLCCALAMVSAMLSPLGRGNMEGYAFALASAREAAEKAEIAGRENADRLSRRVIEAECEAYISDKGSELGLGRVRTEVRAKWGDAFWYPYELWLDTEPSEKLRIFIEGELGIPPERIHWSNEAEGTGKDN